MDSLSINPIFKSKNVRHTRIKGPKPDISTIKVSSQEPEFGKVWTYVDKFVLKKIEQLKAAPFSNEPFPRNLEMKLKSEGVNVRFKNNIELAKYIEKGIATLKANNIPLPKNIFFVSSLTTLSGILGLTYMLRNNRKESPIILPNNVARQAKKIKRDYERGYISTPNPLHTFFHEVGHWLHFQKGFDILRNVKIWQNVDTKQVEREVSRLAVKREDGSEFCAEIFAAKQCNLTYSPQIVELALKLFANL